MFDNIGEKIKNTATAITILGIICSVIYAVVLFQGRYTQAAGVVVLILGPLLSWMGSLALYGFGELIETAQSINRRLLNAETAINNIKPAVQAPQSSARPAAPEKNLQDEPIKQIKKEEKNKEKEILERCSKHREQFLRSSGNDPRITYWVRNLDQWLKEGTITPEDYIKKLDQLDQ